MRYPSFECGRVHVNLKLDCREVTIWVGREIFKVSNFCKLILKCERSSYSLKVCKWQGREVWG